MNPQMQDYFLGGQANGNVASTLLNNGMDPNALRPWLGRDGRSYRAVQNGYKTVGNNQQVPTFNTTYSLTFPATMRKDEWVKMDSAVITASRSPLVAWSDLRGSSTYNVPNGLGTIVIQQQTISDNGSATMSMDGLRQGERDRPVYDLRGIPLPIIHADFSFTAREIYVSRTGGPPLDMTMAENATRRVMETVEGLTLGTTSSFTYAGYTIYGYTNFPNRITYSITAPTAAGWTGETFVDDLLAMRQLLIAVRFYGPYMLYISPDWEAYLDADYSAAKGINTLRQRMTAIPSIGAIKTAYSLTGWTILMIQMTSQTAQAIVGMDVRTLQWESHGGMMFNFKVMAIMVPRLRTNQQGYTGIVHAS